MELEFRGTLKSYYSNYPEELKRKELIIEIYNTNTFDKNGEFKKIGEISGYYYNVWHYENLIKMLAIVDAYDGDEIKILDAITLENEVKKTYNNFSLQNFVTIDRLYICKKYRNKGYATEIMKNIKIIIDELFDIAPLKETVIGLIANPFILVDKNENKLNLSLENLEFLGDEKEKKLRKFYTKAGFKQSKSDVMVFYKL